MLDFKNEIDTELALVRNFWMEIFIFTWDQICGVLYLIQLKL